MPQAPPLSDSPTDAEIQEELLAVKREIAALTPRVSRVSARQHMLLPPQQQQHDTSPLCERVGEELHKAQEALKGISLRLVKQRSDAMIRWGSVSLVPDGAANTLEDLRVQLQVLVGSAGALGPAASSVELQGTIKKLQRDVERAVAAWSRWNQASSDAEQLAGVGAALANASSGPARLNDSSAWAEWQAVVKGCAALGQHRVGQTAVATPTDSDACAAVTVPLSTAANARKVDDQLRQLREVQETCLKQLKDQLEDERRKFPRCYFLPDV